MSSDSTSRNSQTDWDRVRALKDEDIDLSEIPEITEKELDGAVLRVGGRSVPEGKSFVGILLDTEVLEYFQGKAGDRGLQTAINETLRASISKA